nr:MAG TPA: hypothetical protein [Caudoviricetes sp.]
MATIKVGGQLESVAVDEKLVDAAQVKDASRDNLSQKDINDELYSRTAQSSEELKGYVKKTDYETDKAAIKKSITDNKSAADTAIKNLQDGKFDKSQLIKSDAPLTSTDDSVYTSKKTDALIEEAKGSASTDLGTAKTELEAKIDTKLDKAKIKSKKSSTAGDVYDAPYVNTELDKKQDKLTAGTNIKIEGSTISCTIDTTLYKVVETLPAKPASGDMNKIHLVPSDETATKNVYKEYIWKGDAWEQLGEYQSTVDLTPYFKKSDITQTLTATDKEKVPSNKAVTDALNSLAFVAGIVQGHYATKALIPSDAADGTYLIDANAAGTAGSYMVTVSGGSVIAQSEHLSTQKGVMYLTKDGTVWKDAQTAAWVNMGRMQTGNTWTVTKNTDGSWRGFDYMNAKAGDTVIINSTQYTLVKWDKAGNGWLINLNVSDAGEKKAKMDVKYVWVRSNGSIYIDDYEAGVTVDTELDMSSSNPVENAVIAQTVNNLQSQISAIEAEKATFTVKRTSGSSIYFVGAAIDAYIQADCSIIADTITISQGGSTKSSATNAKQCIYHETKAAGANTAPTTLTYSAKAVIGDVEKTASVSISVVNPMYVGAGAAYADVVVEGCKQSARTSASGTYNVKVASAGQYVFFVVPSSMTINKVTLSGFDFPLLAADTTSKSGYKIYKSANTYKAGTLTLVVS